MMFWENYVPWNLIYNLRTHEYFYLLIYLLVWYYINNNLYVSLESTCPNT